MERHQASYSRCLPASLLGLARTGITGIGGMINTMASAQPKAFGIRILLEL